MNSQIDLISVSPLLFLTVLSFLLLISATLSKKSEVGGFWLSVAGLVSGIILSAVVIFHRSEAFPSMLTAGGFGNFFNVIFLFSALITILLSHDYIRKTHTDFGEFYLLIILAVIGMMLMASSADLIVVFLGLELMSICLYVLVGFFRKKIKSNESSFKYFLLGAFATGFLLYGIALIYGAAHTTNIHQISTLIPQLITSKLFYAGMGLLLIGLAFKVAAVPFHMWVPDVYEGAPTTITGFMSTGAKAAAFAALILVFATPLVPMQNLKTAIAVVAAASMILGNIVAISQSNIKRMLAYSSVAHAGYMLVGLAAMNALGRSGIIYYIAAYAVMNLGAFGIISLLEGDGERDLQIESYAGLASKKPFLAAMMAIFMLSLSGLPPFGGFFGKYYIFLAALNAQLTWLAILAVLTSVIGVYYYLRVVVLMYFREGGMEAAIKPSSYGVAAIVLSAIAIVYLGVFPAPVLSVIQRLF
jgi:NADH-quinone oxidoreductase subunit N